MFPIVNKPAIEYIANEIVDCGLTTMVLITSKNKDSLVDHFDRNYELENLLANKKKSDLLDSIVKFKNLNLINIRQREPLGSGHAVLTAKDAINNNPFVVILPDMLIKNGDKYMKNMIDIFNMYGKGVIALMEVPINEVSAYGIVKIDKSYSSNYIMITDMIEKPLINEAPSNLAIVGRYVLPNKVLDKLKYIKPDRTGEIQLTNALKELATEEGMIGIIIKDEIHDIGNPLGFVKANISYCLENKFYADELKKYMKKLI
jgi:UTP--glucose-1-phosphate uridylyltransferase